MSPQTIRLDRLALGIPDQRTRTKEVAERALTEWFELMGQQEIVGELIDLELGKSAISILEVTPEMAFERTGIARSHLYFRTSRLPCHLRCGCGKRGNWNS